MCVCVCVSIVKANLNLTNTNILNGKTVSSILIYLNIISFSFININLFSLQNKRAVTIKPN